MRIQPLHDNVFIKPLENKVTEGGLHIPDNADGPAGACRGKVVAVGIGRVDHGRFVPITLRVGDIVVWRRYEGVEVAVEGERFLAMSETAIVAVIGERDLGRPE